MSATPQLDPRGVWERFLTANARFVEGRSEHPRQAADHRRSLLSGQAPHAAILTCSDSRIVPEIIFDQGLGDLFVIRVAGNVLGQVSLASIEYAAEHLEVPLIIVLAHSACGAVTATLSGGDPGGHLVALTEKIAPAVGEVASPPAGDGPDPLEESSTIDEAAKSNAIHVARQLRASQPIVAPRVARGATAVVAAFYDQATGRVEELMET